MRWKMSLASYYTKKAVVLGTAQLQMDFGTVFPRFCFFFFLNIYLGEESWYPWKNARKHGRVGRLVGT